MHRQEMREIGRRLRAVRERARITVADAAQAVGVQPLAVEKWERGRTMPTLLELRRLLPVYGVTAAEVLYDRNPMTFTAEETADLSRAATALNPALRARVDTMLAVMGQAVEPAWKNAA